MGDKETPIVICTTQGEEASVQQGLKQGANAYLTKPIHGPKLLSTVRWLLKRRAGDYGLE